MLLLLKSGCGSGVILLRAHFLLRALEERWFGLRAALLGGILTAIAFLNVPAATIGGFAAAVVYNRDVADPAWRWAIACTWAPAMGMDTAGKYWWAVADGVESVQVRIVVAAAAVIVIAVGVGVVAPLGIAGADKDRARVAATSAIIAGAASICRTHRCVVGVVVAGSERSGGDYDSSNTAKTEVFDHVYETTGSRGSFEKYFGNLRGVG